MVVTNLTTSLLMMRNAVPYIVFKVQKYLGPFMRVGVADSERIKRRFWMIYMHDLRPNPGIHIHVYFWTGQKSRAMHTNMHMAITTVGLEIIFT